MKKQFSVLKSVVFGFLSWVSVAMASQDPVLTQAQGEVMILSSPQSEAHEQVSSGFIRSKFEGKFYLSKKATVGDRLPIEGWLRTLPGARARLIYPNGDQLNVGPASFFKLQSEQKNSNSASMKLDYGMIRAIISKSGPRNQFKVRTPSAVMGVRGTDFVVEASGKNKQTSLTLIRGAVTLQPEGIKSTKEIKTGETAVAEVKKAPETFQTSKIELQRALVLTEKTEMRVASEPIPEAVRKLEEQAKTTTVKDIVQYAKSPEEKAKLEKLAQQSADVASLNAAVVQMQVAKAPVSSPGSQRILEEIKSQTKRTDLQLKDLEKDPYQKYFEATQE